MKPNVMWNVMLKAAWSYPPSAFLHQTPIRYIKYVASPFLNLYYVYAPTQIVFAP